MALRLPTFCICSSWDLLAKPATGFSGSSGLLGRTSTPPSAERRVSTVSPRSSHQCTSRCMCASSKCTCPSDSLASCICWVNNVCQGATSAPVVRVALCPLVFASSATRTCSAPLFGPECMFLENVVLSAPSSSPLLRTPSSASDRGSIRKIFNTIVNMPFLMQRSFGILRPASVLTIRPRLSVVGNRGLATSRDVEQQVKDIVATEVATESSKVRPILAKFFLLDQHD